eukprot:EG_transcript_3562
MPSQEGHIQAHLIQVRSKLRLHHCDFVFVGKTLLPIRLKILNPAPQAAPKAVAPGNRPLQPVCCPANATAWPEAVVAGLCLPSCVSTIARADPNLLRWPWPSRGFCRVVKVRVFVVPWCEVVVLADVFVLIENIFV